MMGIRALNCLLDQLLMCIHIAAEGLVPAGPGNGVKTVLAGSFVGLMFSAAQLGAQRKSLCFLP
jgi:hypothetical protein